MPDKPLTDTQRATLRRWERRRSAGLRDLGSVGASLARRGLVKTERIYPLRRGAWAPYTEYTLTDAGRALLDEMLREEQAALDAARAAEGTVEVPRWALREVVERSWRHHADSEAWTALAVASGKDDDDE